MNPHTKIFARDLELERDLLVEMALEAAGQGAPDRTDWHRLADLTHAITTDVGLVSEQELGVAADHVRRLLLRRGHRLDENFFRSPDLSQPRVLPGGDRLKHGYERNLPAVQLEERLARRCTDLPDGWSCRTLAFSSGMAGLTHVVQTLNYLLGSASGPPVRLDFWGSYFETDIMLEYLSGPGMKSRKLDATRAPVDGSEAIDVLLVEPVRYNWTLDALDPGHLVAQWRRGPHRASSIVLDTTLSSPAWPTRSILAGLVSQAGAPLVVEVRSGLKLDQQGLEIANLGIVDIFTHDNSIQPALSGELVAQTLSLARGTSGACLGVAATAALDAPFLLNERWTRRHAGAVYHHNARLADRIDSACGAFFETVAHPSLVGSANAPFIVIGLREDGLDNHGFLLAVVRHEVERRGLAVVYGSSFGFRCSRFETIIPRVAEGNGLFKISAGSRGGPSLSGFADLLVELAAFPSMDALRAAYDVTPLSLS